MLPSHLQMCVSHNIYIRYNKQTENVSPFVGRSLDRHVALKGATRLEMYVQTNVGLLCRVGSGSYVATALDITMSMLILVLRMLFGIPRTQHVHIQVLWVHVIRSHLGPEKLRSN
jgi:hypothetical protein